MAIRLVAKFWDPGMSRDVYCTNSQPFSCELQAVEMSGVVHPVVARSPLYFNTFDRDPAETASMRVTRTNSAGATQLLSEDLCDAAGPTTCGASPTNSSPNYMHVRAWGFQPNMPVELQQCIVGTTTVRRCVRRDAIVPDADGNFTTDIVV